ncbi:MAG: hypothetical protein K2I33_05015, partial [Oscillospiraceae bacterium]|nr:hypothetical protein [Oscillospiraceae bacterium]
KRELIGFIFTVVIGSLMHFVYEWTGENSVVSIIAPVNESTWEHLKLLFYPSALFSVAAYLLTKTEKNYITVKAFSILAGMLSIVIIFYTYTGIIGQNFLWADILTFIIGAAVVYYMSEKKLKDLKLGNVPGIIVLLSMVLLFILFTFNPPSIGLFEDPLI